MSGSSSFRKRKLGDISCNRRAKLAPTEAPPGLKSCTSTGTVTDLATLVAYLSRSSSLSANRRGSAKEMTLCAGILVLLRSLGRELA